MTYQDDLTVPKLLHTPLHNPIVRERTQCGLPQLRDATREEIEKWIIRHITSKDDMMYADVALVWELVFAMCWCKETRELALEQMRKVEKLNLKERMNNNLH